MKVWMRILCVVLVICLSGCAATPQASEAPAAAATEPGVPETVAPVTEPTVAQLPETESPETEPLETVSPETLPAATESPATQPALPEEIEPADDDFVRIREYIPTASVGLAYATEDNFTGQRIYEFTEPWLRYGTVKKLKLVQEELEPLGLYLKIWDGFRPAAAQFVLWEVCPIPTYVANPNNGFSSHSRGNTVDITLVDKDGNEIEMPTAFDDFSVKADRNYSDCTPQAAENSRLLEKAMRNQGFVPHYGEWWHYVDATAYPVEQTFQPVEETGYYADCDSFIALRIAPSEEAEILAQIGTLEEFRILARYGQFAYVSYCGLKGYVPATQISPIVQPRTP